MGVGMIGAGQNHPRVGGHLKVELVKYALILVYFAKLFVQVVRHIECLHGHGIISHVPDVHGQVVSREEVIVTRRGKLGHANRVYYLREEVLSRWVLLKFNLRRRLVYVGRHTQIAQTDVAIAR